MTKIEMEKRIKELELENKIMRETINEIKEITSDEKREEWYNEPESRPNEISKTDDFYPYIVGRTKAKVQNMESYIKFEKKMQDIE